MTERMRIEGVPYKPTIREIFGASTSQDNNSDWEAEIMGSADPKDLKTVNEFLAQYSVPSEAEDALNDYLEEKRLDDY